MRIRGLGAKRVVLLGALAVAVAGVSLAVTVFVGAFGTKESLADGKRMKSARIGNARALQASYEQWKAQYVGTEGDRTLVLPLGYSKGLSARFTKAQGHARLDLADGTISVEVTGLPADEAFEVWLVDNRPGPGRSVRPEAGDNLVRAGELKRVGDVFALRAQLGRELLTGFELDLIVVAPGGGHPGADGLLFGAPTLFHRLYYSEQRTTVAPVASAPGPAWTPFGVLVPRPAWAQTTGTADLQAQIDRGRDLFFNETFEGNGRTCGTCHPAENNFTLDRAFIAALANTDPLFVAEFNLALAELENPQLMRNFGLILENVDGFDRPGVMRGVPHTLALRTSEASSGGPRLGWSGDGAPGDGTLRSFAIGAVIQHFPKTLARQAVVDFRLPTDEELDALEAFQLSTGRQVDRPLASILFKNTDVEEGKQLFISNGCNACHANAGANSAFGNAGNSNFNTGVASLPHPAATSLPSEPMPPDGGFGKAGDLTNGFGDKTFNTPTVIEAADTAPFFHNNAVASLAGAVAFYNDEAFTGSPAGQQFFGGNPLLPEAGQVEKVTNFLRVINAVENIDSSKTAKVQAMEANFADARELLRFAIGENDDANMVLTDGELHRDARLFLRLSRVLSVTASRTPLPGLRNALIGQAIVQDERAKALLATVVQQ